MRHLRRRLLTGGLGTAEVSMAGMFAFVLAMPAGQAAAATLMVRLATLWLGVTVGLAAWALWRRQLFEATEVPPTMEAFEEPAVVD